MNAAPAAAVFQGRTSPAIGAPRRAEIFARRRRSLDVTRDLPALHLPRFPTLLSLRVAGESKKRTTNTTKTNRDQQRDPEKNESLRAALHLGATGSRQRDQQGQSVLM